MKATSQSGFNLFQIAFLVAAVGIIVGGLFANWNTAQDTSPLVVTQDRQNRIALALSNYLQNYGRLPCPGNVNGATIETIGIAANACNTPNSREGIVPYATLGIHPLDIYDGWGNLFTYVVQANISQANNGAGTVHDQCRTNPDWIPVATNLNPIKANICCRSINADRLIVRNAANQEIVPAQILGVGSSFQNPDTPATTIAGSTLTYVAYVLISHGENQGGAFSLGVVGKTPSVKAAMSPNELENQDGDNELIASVSSEVPYFDDIVLYRTQQQMMRDLGGTGCGQP